MLPFFFICVFLFLYFIPNIPYLERYLISCHILETKTKTVVPCVTLTIHLKQDIKRDKFMLRALFTISEIIQNRLFSK